MADDMDWDDIANMWWSHFEDMQTQPNPQQVGKRGRARSRTPSTRKRFDRAPSRAKGMQPRRLTFSSARTRSRSRSASEPRKKLSGKAAFFALSPPGQSPAETERRWRKTAQGKRNQANVNRLLKTRKVRHKLTRKHARKIMPRGGKPYTRPKGKKGYRGAVMPRWAKGETKHVLIQDGHISGGSGQVSTTSPAGVTTLASPASGAQTFNIGTINSWCLNPVKQDTGRGERNGASVDGTYLRIQGHIHNVSNTAHADDSASAAGKQRAYVRMLVLAVKGGRDANTTSGVTRPRALFSTTNLFKKIDGSLVGFSETITDASERVRTLQLGVNKQAYTVLADRKYELSGAQEGFGASDRLFDLKMKLKQRTTWQDAKIDNFEKNQLVFVLMTVDPSMDTTTISNAADSRKDAIQIEFESKYSYKDF